MTYGSTLVVEQERLARITRRQQRTNHIQNRIREAMRDSSGDDLQ